MMKDTMIIQGRTITCSDIELIRHLLLENPSWHRTRLSKELCSLWDWRNLKGHHKDMACRSLLLKLEKLGYISLPPRRVNSGGNSGNRRIRHIPHSTSPITGPLKSLLPLQIATASDTHARSFCNFFLSLYHYLGYRSIVGQNMKYLVSDRYNNPLACLLFGSAAWKVKPRDAFIGWNVATRTQNLHSIVNNMRFLILPRVRVPHLASHLLARIASRISDDWSHRYGHPLYLLETFVERDRFHGTCYKAANWIHVGHTQGRSRNDRDHLIQVPVKDIYLYPLSKHFRSLLLHEN